MKKILFGLIEAIKLNVLFLYYRYFLNKKILVFRFDSYAQITHLDNVINNIMQDKNIFMCLLINPVYIFETKQKYNYVYNSYATEGLFFFDVFIGVSQIMRTPKFRKKNRILSFYGQPAKGFGYKVLNYSGYDIFFFYGQYMLDFYKQEKQKIPQMKNREYQIFTTGQPKTDNFFRLAKEKSNSFFVEKLGLDVSKKTILYAPSYEYCSSLETNGDEILQTLIDTGYNIVIKTHPMIFNLNSEYSKNWLEKLNDMDKRYDNFLFYKDIDIDDAILACDIFFTDYSGVAFDAIGINKKLIYWYCPKFYDEYLPKQYGIDTEIAKKELWGTVGRGEVGFDVRNIEQLKKAIEDYFKGDDPFKEKREKMSDYIFAYKGNAAKQMTDKIYEILES